LCAILFGNKRERERERENEGRTKIQEIGREGEKHSDLLTIRGKVKAIIILGYIICIFILQVQYITFTFS
jgi:hypothetical protein